MNSTKLLIPVMAAVLFAASTFADSRIGDRLNLSVSVFADYTDNRDASSSGRESSTWDLGISPKIETKFDFQPTRLALSYMPTLRHRTDPAPNQNENKVLHDLVARLNHDTGRRLSWSITERFNYTDDPEIMTGDRVERWNRSFIFNRLDAQANVFLARRAMLVLQGNHDLKRYRDSDVSMEDNENRYAAQARLLRQQTKSLAISLLGRYVSVERSDALDLRRDFNAQYFGAGLRNVFSKHLVGEVDAGYQTVVYDAPDVDDASTPFVKARLTYKPTALTGFYIGGAYSATDAYSYPFISQNRSHIHGGVTWDVAPDITVGLDGEYRVENYESDKIDPGTPEEAYVKDLEGDKTTLLLNARISIKLRDGLTATLRHIMEDVDSDVSTTFKRNATRLSLTKVF